MSAFIMFVKSMEYGPGGFEKTVVEPAWHEVEVVLRSLDGELLDSVALDSGKSYMGIAGGESNRYVVAGYLEGFGSFICASGAGDGPAVNVSVAGDYNAYAPKYVLNLDMVMDAAKAFYERGELGGGLQWEMQHQ